MKRLFLWKDRNHKRKVHSHSPYVVYSANVVAGPCNPRQYLQLIASYSNQFGGGALSRSAQADPNNKLIHQLTSKAVYPALKDKMLSGQLPGNR